jgi:hypothetical protein
VQEEAGCGRMTMRIATAGLAAFLWCGAAFAQPPAAAPASAPATAPDAEQLALGRRLAAAGDFNAIVGAMGAAEVERMARETPDLSDAERARLREVGAATFAASRARLLETVGAIYARHFTAAQLTEITAFLESAAGRAYIGAFPRLLPEIAQTMQGLDLAAAIGAAFCRETGKLCAPPPRQ